ncbi:hypothetical protein J416_04768 [Gracilibacillus halophilus YIM-C55.5]|uniref:RNase H type-1 domain-containing protein n=1 Tax=Gracilibacillus halophilus YIM-C55.5 TaxID=1308866 RepID=N4WM96_9BACI|nr:ribonuclease HI family protein [Gracilibacillus halophilus]ENH97302.1 hypothetical protein J416_04768 [Gracilibacillus halophilus YIM-C55.5]
MLEVYTDAATKGNPGPSAIAIVWKKDKQQEVMTEAIGTYSNHEAEFYAVERALQLSIEYYPHEILSFRSDSKVVVDTIEKNYTGNAQFQPYLARITQLADAVPYFFIKWIPEKQNGQADKLARQTLKDM